MSGMVFFFVPAVIFMGLVLPLWLILHYISKSRQSRGLSAQDRQALVEALEVVEKLEDRIETLEAILDADHSNWRTRRSGSSGTASARSE